MTAPRPSEADVEALTLAINGLLLTKGWAATGDDIARAVLASDWLAARDAEREREVAVLRATKAEVHRELEKWEALAYSNGWQYDQAVARAEAAERALAGLRREVKALVDEWAAKPDYRGYYGDRARDLRALLPRDDAAGAGGAG